MIYNMSNSRSDVYEIQGDVRIDAISSRILVGSTTYQDSRFWSTRPYPRKGDTLAMGRVKNFTIQFVKRIPNCNRIFTAPAIIFSTGGYAGNHFHTFTDVLIPLFSTSYKFNRTVIFLLADKYPGWTSKYKLILDRLSKYEVHEIDNENRVLCFSRVIVGLKADKELTVDLSTSAHYSMSNFTRLLRSAYSLERESLDRIKQPRMLVIHRRRGRHLVNRDAMADMARGLGFDVVVKQMVENVTVVARLVNSFDVLVGVHGAGLTNMVFLPENALVIQIVPFGLEFLARNCFKKPAESMNLRYLEYKASLNESSLSELDNIIYGDPAAINNKGFDGFRSVYMDNQDINLDLARFRGTLLRALELIPLSL